MKGLAGWTALAIAMLSSLAMPAASWAGSAQTTLAVGVVVPARCAVRTPAVVSGLSAVGIETVAMRCTKGTLPSAGGPAGPVAVSPQISRDLVAAAFPVPPAPRPVSNMGLLPVDASGPHLVITVNF